MTFEYLDEVCQFNFYFVLGPSCGANKFKCGDGSCIPNYWKCDEFEDCADGSDEVNCSTTTTPTTTTTTTATTTTTRGINSLYEY